MKIRSFYVLILSCLILKICHSTETILNIDNESHYRYRGSLNDTKESDQQYFEYNKFEIDLENPKHNMGIITILPRQPGTIACIATFFLTCLLPAFTYVYVEAILNGYTKYSH